MLKIKDLHKDHSVVLAAHEMVIQHRENDMMLGAVEAVKAKFEDVSNEFLIVLWIGINSKNRNGK